MKYLLIILITLIIEGCSSQSSVKNEEKVNCLSAPKIWWGEKGESPVNNNLWKCYDWVLQKR